MKIEGELPTPQSRPERDQSKWDKEEMNDLKE